MVVVLREEGLRVSVYEHAVALAVLGVGLLGAAVVGVRDLELLLAGVGEQLREVAVEPLLDDVPAVVPVESFPDPVLELLPPQAARSRPGDQTAAATSRRAYACTPLRNRRHRGRRSGEMLWPRGRRPVTIIRYDGRGGRDEVVGARQLELRHFETHRVLARVGGARDLERHAGDLVDAVRVRGLRVEELTGNRLGVAREVLRRERDALRLAPGDRSGSNDRRRCRRAR